MSLGSPFIGTVFGLGRAGPFWDVYVGSWGIKMRCRVFHTASTARKPFQVKVHILLDIPGELNFKESFHELMFFWH